MPGFRHEASTHAPIRVVWQVVQDHENVDRLLPPGGDRLAKSWLAEEGTADRNGIGAVRKFGKLPLAERVVEFEAPKRMAYTIENSPIKGYRGVVELTERPDGGTDVVWTGDFERPTGLPGAVMARVMGSIVGGMLRRAVQIAERRTV